MSTHSDLREVGELSYDARDIISSGSFGNSVFSGLFQSSTPVAIKRIMRSSKNEWIDQEVDFIFRAAHPNVLHYYCLPIPRDNDFWYLASELCAGTLQNLVEEKRIRKGDHREILYQVTTALRYLHKFMKMVKRPIDIKPTNILFENPPYEGGGFTIKLDISSFLSKHYHYSEGSGDTYMYMINPWNTWMAPELYHQHESLCTPVKGNIFSLGLIFGYTLSGRHPFGDLLDREYRIKNKEPMVLTLEDLKEAHADYQQAFKLVQSMLEFEPARRPTSEEILIDAFFSKIKVTPSPTSGMIETVDDKIGFYRSRLLGSGAFACVYTGMFQGNLVAVKRIAFGNPHVGRAKHEREVVPMQKLQHPNIVHYLYSTTDRDFLYIVTELCKGTLYDWIKGPLHYDGPKIEDERNILLQVTHGLEYLHENNISHRDIKPHNILIYVDERFKQSWVKLGDFGICSMLSAEDNGFTNTNVVNPTGTRGYMAPEMYELSRIPTGSKVDIFALGCVFGCTLSVGGKHPFGDDEVDQSFRIKEKRPMILSRRDLKSVFSEDELAFKLIQSMVKVNPEERPTAAQIRLDSFFNKPLSYN